MNMMSVKPGMQKASLKQRIAIYELMKGEDVVRKIDDQMCEYLNGWNDNKVAQAVGGGVTAAMVDSVRREMFGRVRNIRSDAGGVDTAEVAELRARMDEMQRKLDEYVTQASRLISTLEITNSNLTRVSAENDRLRGRLLTLENDNKAIGKYHNADILARMNAAEADLKAQRNELAALRLKLKFS